MSDSNHLEPLKSASPEVQKIIKEVLKLESEKLYQERPRLKSEIIEIIKGAVS